MLRRDPLILAIIGLLSLGTLGWVMQRDIRPGYAAYQEEFTRLVRDQFGPERAAAVPRGVQQIWVQAAGRADRCTTCHLGVSWTGLEDAPEPYRTHPTGPLKNHPIERFGCTLCHGGQGSATELPAAHGWVKHWEDPLLDSRVAEDYGFERPYAMTEIKCNLCHRYEVEVAGMDEINRAKKLVGEKGCRSCHTINGRGGTIGPDLTAIGEKRPELYDFERLTNFPSVFNWHVGHFQAPKAFSPGTVMPDYGFKSDEARALTLLLLSWRRHDVPLELLPIQGLKDIPTAAEAEQEQRMRTGEGRFFVEKTCFVCHDVSSLGIFSAAKIGPDLSQAAESVPRRLGRTLEDFLKSPTGTMSVVLAKQIPLTSEERAEAARLLRLAHEKFRAQQAGEGATPAPPPGEPAGPNAP